MSIKAKIEAVIYAAEEPVTFEQIYALVKDDARQELLTAQAEAADALARTPESQAGVVPAEEDHEADLAAAPLAAADEASEAFEEAPAEDTAPASEDVPELVQALAAEGDATSATETAQPPADAGPAPITEAQVKAAVRAAIQTLIADYVSPERGIEVRQIAGGYRMATKPEQHDAVRAFAKSLKPPVRLSLAALETLAVIAYKQPITAPEISEVRGVDAGGVLGTLLERKLITTAGRKQVIGRPILYKTTKEFLLRFGLKDVSELPSMEEFEKLAAESLGSDLFAAVSPTPEQAAALTVAAEAPVPASAAAAEEQAAVPAISEISPESAAVQTAGMEAPIAMAAPAAAAEVALTASSEAAADAEQQSASELQSAEAGNAAREAELPAEQK